MPGDHLAVVCTLPRDAVISRLTAEFGHALVFGGHYRWVVRRGGEEDGRVLNVAVDFEQRPMEARVCASRPGQSEESPTAIFPLRDSPQLAGLIAIARAKAVPV